MSLDRDIFEVYVEETMRHAPVIYTDLPRPRDWRLGFNTYEKHPPRRSKEQYARASLVQAKRRAKLSDEQVHTIRNSTESNRSLARRFSIDHKTIGKIKNGTAYKWVK